MSDESRTPSRRWAIPLGIVLVVVIALAVGRYLLHRAESNTNKVALADNPKAVTAIEAREATFRPTHRYVGTLEPWLSARVGPQLASGFVETVLVRPGAVVKRGAVLATLDCRNASAANQAVAMQARALEQRQRAAAKEAARLAELLDGGYVSQNELEQKQAKAAADSAQMQALLAQAAGKSLEVNDCVLRAAFDGEIASRYADPGSFVRPGQAIVELIDRSIVRLTGDVPEVDFDAVAPKTQVRIRMLATGRSLTAEIVRRAPAADRSTRTVHFEVDLPDPKREIPVGTTAEIFIDVGDPVPATEIPLLAAKIRAGRATLFVVENGMAKKLSVPVLGERDASLFVAPDLPAGSLVVTQGRSLLANSDRVAAKVEPAKPQADSEP